RGSNARESGVRCSCLSRSRSGRWRWFELYPHLAVSRVIMSLRPEQLSHGREVAQCGHLALGLVQRRKLFDQNRWFDLYGSRSQLVRVRRRRATLQYDAVSGHQLVAEIPIEPHRLGFFFVGTGGPPDNGFVNRLTHLDPALGRTLSVFAC